MSAPGCQSFVGRNVGPAVSCHAQQPTVDQMKHRFLYAALGKAGTFRKLCVAEPDRAARHGRR